MGSLQQQPKLLARGWPASILRRMEPISSLADLESVLGETALPVVLFKHSTSCPISAGALRQYQAFVLEHGPTARFTFLDLIANRDVSDAIAERLKIEHESPQVIVLRDGAVTGVLTHTQIRQEALEKLLGDAPNQPV